MKHTIITDELNEQIFEAVCQRAANGHNDLMDTAQKLLDVKNKLFTKEQIQLVLLLKLATTNFYRFASRFSSLALASWAF